MSPTQTKQVSRLIDDAATPGGTTPPLSVKHKKPSQSQRQWLVRGLNQTGGKLPLFLDDGQRVSERTVKSCVQNGWAEPALKNPIRPGWQICRLTASGRKAVSE